MLGTCHLDAKSCANWPSSSTCMRDDICCDNCMQDCGLCFVLSWRRGWFDDGDDVWRSQMKLVSVTPRVKHTNRLRELIELLLLLWCMSFVFLFVDSSPETSMWWCSFSAGKWFWHVGVNSGLDSASLVLLQWLLFACTQRRPIRCIQPWNVVLHPINHCILFYCTLLWQVVLNDLVEAICRNVPFNSRDDMKSHIAVTVRTLVDKK